MPTKQSVKTVARKPVKKKNASAKSRPQKNDYRLNVGDRAPAVRGTSTLDGGPELKGKIVVLYFYPKDNTPGCTLEGRDFAKLYPAFRKLGAEVLGVSRDSLRSHEGFREKCSFPFHLIADEDESLCRAFDVMQMKKLYGREFRGVERSTFVISADGRLARAWRKVKVDGHARAVLEFVESLKAGDA